jgi:hypothetical protein
MEIGHDDDEITQSIFRILLEADRSLDSSIDLKVSVSRHVHLVGQGVILEAGRDGGRGTLLFPRATGHQQTAAVWPLNSSIECSGDMKNRNST